MWFNESRKSKKSDLNNAMVNKLGDCIMTLAKKQFKLSLLTGLHQANSLEQRQQLNADVIKLTNLRSNLLRIFESGLSGREKGQVLKPWITALENYAESEFTLDVSKNVELQENDEISTADKEEMESTVKQNLQQLESTTTAMYALINKISEDKAPDQSRSPEPK